MKIGAIHVWKVLVGFGLFLMVMGFVGWGTTGFSAKGKTAVASGAMTGVVMVTCGLAARWAWLYAKRWERACVLTGVVFAVLFGGVFAWRATVAWMQLEAGQPKLGVAILLSSMSTVAVGVAVCVGWAARGARGRVDGQA